MRTYKKLLFKVNDEVIIEEKADLYLNQIDEIKWGIARELSISVDDVEVETVTEMDITTDIDVTIYGMIFWKALFHEPIVGVYCDLEEGSDEHLDAIINGTIENHLHFFI